MEKDKRNQSPLEGVGIGRVRDAVVRAASLRTFSLLLQKPSLDVIQAQQGEVEQMKASTCLKKVEDSM